MPEPNPMASGIKLEKFMGRHQDPQAWWDNFCQWAEFYNYNEAKQLASFIFHMDESVTFWYRQLGANQKDTLVHLHETFIDRYKHDGAVDQNLLNVSQGQTETTEDYIDRIIKLFSNKDIPTLLQVAIAQNGLRSNIKYVVGPHDPKTLDELSRVSVLAERSVDAPIIAATTASVDLSSLSDRMAYIEKLLTTMLS